MHLHCGLTQKLDFGRLNVIDISVGKEYNRLQSKKMSWLFYNIYIKVLCFCVCVLTEYFQIHLLPENCN